jgi:tyrosyl-tRNA synthetase
VLDPQRTQVLYNGDWLSQLSFKDVIGLAANFTVQQFLVRENFSLRFTNGEPIWLHEFFYALMQGYDAVATRTDIQIGGTDQLFNLIAGRKLMETFGLRPQTILTFPILVGTDGLLRMSKTTGNHIGISEAPEVIFGKVMSIPDSAMRNYADLVTRWRPEEIMTRFAALEAGQLHPRDLKLQLAHEIVEIFHGAHAAEAAEEHFRTVFQQRELPTHMPELRLLEPTSVIDILTHASLAPTRSEARRLVQQGGIKLDGERVDDHALMVMPDREHILQVGRRKFLKLLSHS